VEDANCKGRKSEEEYEKWGLKYSVFPYFILVTDHSEELQVSGNKIPTVKQVKYLGSIVEENGSSDLEIEKKRIIEARKFIDLLNSVLWNRNILPSTKVFIYKSVVKYVLTHGAETW
jgi:hypothetical protein